MIETLIKTMSFSTRYLARLKPSRLSIPTVLLLSLILLSIFYYWASIRAEGGKFTLTIAPATIGCNTIYRSDGYFIASSDDRLSFDIVVTSAPWFLNISVMDLISGERYVFTRTYYSIRAPTPEFVVPRTSLYMYNVSVVFLSRTNETGKCIVSARISGVQSIRYEVIDRIPYYIGVVLLLSLIIEYLLRKTLVKKRSIMRELLTWEMRMMASWMFFAITLYTYALFYTNFSSSIGMLIDVIAGISSFSRAFNYFVIYLFITAALTNLLFTYTSESGFEKTLDLLPVNRSKRFAVKVIVLILMLYLPLFIAVFLEYFIWIPDLICRRPDIFFPIFFSQMLHYLLILFTILTFTLLPSIVFSRTSMGIIVSTLPVLILYAYSNSLPRTLYIINLFKLTRTTLTHFLLNELPNIEAYIGSTGLINYITRNAPLAYMITYTSTFIVVLLISRILYVNREAV